VNSDAAITLLKQFLERSPRSALEVQVLQGDQHWSWQHGEATRVESPVFEIGSVSKVFTTTLLALLVQRGQVSLADTLSRFYPQLPCVGHITLQQLASHTSGLPRDPFSRWGMLYRGRQLIESFQSDDLIEFLQQLTPAMTATGKAHYSNVGMALLGRVLEIVCGQPYAMAVEEHILRPLGMSDTHLDMQQYDEQRLMQGHDSRGRPVPPFAWRGMEPAGGWRSTGDDMMTFLRAQVGLYGEGWSSRAELATQPLAGMTRDIRTGCGWMLSEHPSIGCVAWHNGGTFGQHSMVAFALKHPTAVVLLTDRSPPWWHHLMSSRQLESLPVQLLEAINQH